MTNKSDNFLSRIDWLTVSLYIVIMIFGWFSICGASVDIENPDLFGFGSRSGKQLVWIFCALSLGAALLTITQKFFLSYSYVIYWAFIALLIVTIFIGTDTKGSNSWLHFGPVSIQPAEFAKFATALALAKYIDKYDFNASFLKNLIPAIGIFMLPMLLIIAQKETGSAIVYCAFFLVLYREGMTGYVLLVGFCAVLFFVLGVKYWNVPFSNQPFNVGPWIVLLIIHILTVIITWFSSKDIKTAAVVFLASVGVMLVGLSFSVLVIPFDITVLQLISEIFIVFYLVIRSIKDMLLRYVWVAVFSLGFVGYLYSVNYVFENILEPHQQTRIDVVLGLKDDPYGAEYNVNQSKIAIGSGGFSGKGFMKGTQTKLKFVPEQDTDFIFCTVGEEQGFLGSAIVLLLYSVLLLRIITLSERQHSTSGRVYGYSVASILFFHLFVNIGMVLGITPVIGIPLPFFSYGGSSLWGFTILLFVFLRIDAERSARY
jgi:rod shape determining protein RodA